MGQTIFNFLMIPVRIDWHSDTADHSRDFPIVPRSHIGKPRLQNFKNFKHSLYQGEN